MELKLRKQCPSRITEAQYNKILELKEQVLPNLTIAQRVGVSAATVRSVYRKKNGFMPTLKDQVKDRYDRTGENNLTPVEEIDIDNGKGYFCIDKFGELYGLTNYNHRYKRKS